MRDRPSPRVETGALCSRTLAACGVLSHPRMKTSLTDFVSAGTTQARRVATVLSLVVCASACGTTNADAIAALTPDYAAERARLASYATMLPPPAVAAPATTVPPFAPPLVWAEADSHGATSNAAFLAAAELLDPDAPDVPNGPDVDFDSALARCLRWTGPANPMAASSMGARNGDQILADCRAALAVPYLVVLRPVHFTPANATDTATFTPAMLVADVLVLRHDTGAVVASARIEARSADTVRYVYREGEDQVQALTHFAYSTMWTNARAAIVAAFAAGGHTVTPR